MKKILISENSPEQGHMLSLMLKKVGFDVIQKMDLAQLKQQVTQQDVRAVILDIMMPEISGDMLITEIRKIDPMIPIVMITAVTNNEMRIKCMQRGANYYMTKPVSLADMETVFKQYL